MNYYSNKDSKKGIYQLRGHIEDDRNHYINKIKPIFKLLYNIDLNLREMPSTRVFGFQIWSNNLVNFKQKLNLPLGKKLNIIIPKIFLTNNTLKKSVIRGIFDTDGGIYLEKKNNKLYPRLEIRTISINLAEQLLNILTGLGFRTTKHSEHFNKDANRKEAYVISIRGVEMFHEFMKEISPKNQKHQDKYTKFLNSQTL